MWAKGEAALKNAQKVAGKAGKLVDGVGAGLDLVDDATAGAKKLKKNIQKKPAKQRN